MDLSIHGQATGRQSATTYSGSTKIGSTPDAPRPGGQSASPQSVMATNPYHRDWRHGDTNMEPREASRQSHDRPDCVPALNLGKLVNSDNILTQPMMYDDKLDTPNTASTVSWGAPALSTPFALHYPADQQMPSERRHQQQQYQSYREQQPQQSYRGQQQQSYREQQQQSYREQQQQSYREQQQQQRYRQQQQQQQSYRQQQQQYQSFQDPYNSYRQPGNDMRSARNENIGTGRPGSAHNPIIGDRAILEDNTLLHDWKAQSSVQHPVKKEAEELAIERKRNQLVETVMVDQLSRAVISDPEQDARDGGYSAPMSSYGRGRIRTLHESKVKTTGTATEQLLSKRLMFSARLLTRNGRDAIRELCGFYFMHDNTMTLYEYRQFGKKSSALPFVQRGCYKHVIGRRKGYSYVIQDIYVGSTLSFETCNQTSLPEAVQKSDVMLVRVTDVDEKAKAHFVFDGRIPGDPDTFDSKMRPPFTNQEFIDMKLKQEIQSEVQKQLRKRGVKTMTGLGQHFRKMDRTGDGKLDKDELRKALQVYHIDVVEEKFESLWHVLDQNGDGCIDYGEFVRGFIGEMSEWRKSLVRKAFQKIDASKTGYLSFNDIRKFFMAHAHPQVTAGQVSEMDVLNALLDSFEHCKRAGEISYNDFEDYYEGLSLSINDNSSFADVVTCCWGL